MVNQSQVCTWLFFFDEFFSPRDLHFKYFKRDFFFFQNLHFFFLIFIFFFSSNPCEELSLSLDSMAIIVDRVIILEILLSFNTVLETFLETGQEYVHKYIAMRNKQIPNNMETDVHQLDKQNPTNLETDGHQSKKQNPNMETDVHQPGNFFFFFFPSAF